MLGKIGQNSTKKKSCNNAIDFQSISLSGLQFAKQIAENKAPNCPGIYQHTLIHVYLQKKIFPWNNTSNILICPSFSALCHKSSYHVGIQTFDQLSIVSIDEKQQPNSTMDHGNENYKTSTNHVENEQSATNENKPARTILLYYSTTNVRISSTSTLISLSSFISSIGGNLGLFVGFSFMSVFLVVYKCLTKITPPSKKDKIVLDGIVHTSINPIVDGDFVTDRVWRTEYYL